jgi:5-methylcytosine-specific restriction endonuclease McrA
LISEPAGVIAFAERVLELLDEGRYTTSYKYAVLLALIDLCLEGTEQSGAPPHVLTTVQVANKIVELYWPHTLPFVGRAASRLLVQSTLGQAEIVSDIRRFRERHAPDPSIPRWEAGRAARGAYGRLVRQVEWKLIEMPLPRLQMMGRAYDPFIYAIHWDDRVRRRDVAAYLAGEAGAFDNRLLLKPGVGDHLRLLSGLLRPLIQRRWAAMVAQLNGLEESQLDAFLFGADRVQTAKVRAGLWEIQGRRCFYCDARVTEPVRAHVDHFIPWSRYPDDGLDNLVVADVACNQAKSNSLAASHHVARWAQRFASDSSQRRDIDTLARETAWDRDRRRSLGVARGIYWRLPRQARLWLRQREFVALDRPALEQALAVVDVPDDTRR